MSASSVERACASATWPRPLLSSRGSSPCHDVEREVLEHPDADPVALGRRAVRAAEETVVDRLGGARETVAMEGAVDDRRDPPAGDRSLRSSKRPAAMLDPGQRRAKLGGECPAKIAAACSTDSVVGPRSVSPRSAAIEVEVTPGIPHGSISSKSARSTVTFEGDPVVAHAALDPQPQRADLARIGAVRVAPAAGWPSRRAGRHAVRSTGRDERRLQRADERRTRARAARARRSGRPPAGPGRDRSPRRHVPPG